MALPGTDYNPATGLDLSGGSNVAEYVINEFGGAAFRLVGGQQNRTPGTTQQIGEHLIISGDAYA